MKKAKTANEKQQMKLWIKRWIRRVKTVDKLKILGINRFIRFKKQKKTQHIHTINQ